MARKVPLSGLSPELSGKVPPFHVMTKPRGPVCNLECAYCYYLSKERLYPDSDFLREPETVVFLNPDRSFPPALSAQNHCVPSIRSNPIIRTEFRLLQMNRCKISDSRVF